MRRWIRRILVVVLVLVLLIGVAAVYTVRRSFPTRSGELVATGLEAETRVTRTEEGVPRIVASTSHDLFFTQGFVHAQDRFWQMDFWRHIGAGRLSELFGADQVETDIFLRTMGWRRVAEQEYDILGEETRAALDAYAEGVNAYLAGKAPAEVSLEYSILGLQNSAYQIEPWTPFDTLTWTKVMAWDLRANLDEELDRAMQAAKFGVERAEQLYPAYREDFPVIVDPSITTAGTGSPPTMLLPPAPLQELIATVAGVDAVIGQRFEGIGSNNWVVSGDRTASGLPLLANDPHLGIQMPSIWYENALSCSPKGDACPFDVVGFSFPGAPGVVIGHNDRIAWGVTNEAPDSMDVFIEKVEDDTHYTAPDGSRQFEVRVETIEVAGGDPVEVDVRSTIHGPVISEVYVDDGSLAGSERVEVPASFVTTLSWTALQPGTTVEAIIDYNQASNWDEFRAAVAKFQIAAQNFVYADVEGNIGYQSTGKIPVRDGWDGRYPAAGWLHEPVDTFLDPTGLPSMFNPPSGFILTANQPVNRVGPGDGTGQYIGSDHSTGYRASRIFELLEGTSGATVEDLLAIQLDVADGSAGYLVPLLTGLEIEGAEPLLDLLSGWSPPYAMDGDSAAAAAYAGVWAHLVTNTFADELGDNTPEDHSRLFGVFWELVQRPDDLWWDDTSTADARETRDSILAASVADAYADLKERLGEDTTKWRWGDLHTATFQNQTFGKSGIGPIEAIFNRTSPPELGGGGEIVNAIGWTAVNGYEVDWLPSFRMVVDLSDFGSSMAVHTTGQSGHAYQPNYFDMNPHWVEGTALPLPWGEIAGDTLVLTPG